MRRIAILLLAAALAGCVDPPTPLRPPTDLAVGPAGPAPFDGAQRGATNPRLVAPLPEFPQLQPEIGAGSGTRVPYVYQPGTSVPAIPAPVAPPSSPITGYGLGGMGYAPGSAPNPPYFYGGVPR